MTHSHRAYCQQQIRHLQGLRFGLYSAKLALPVFTTTLVLLFILKWLYPAVSPAALAILPLLLLLLLILVYHQGHWRLDAWKVAAFIDQQAEAKGRFMQAVETNQPELLPTALPVIRFPTVIPPTLGLAWLGLIVGFVLWGWLPVSPPPLPATLHITPQPIAELEARLQQLDKTQHPILAEQIEQALQQMRQRRDGLTAEDFNALTDLNKQLLSQLETQTQPLSSGSPATVLQNHANALVNLLQQPTLQPQHWQQLAEHAQALSEHLQAQQPPGQSSHLAEQLAELAQQMTQQAQAATTHTEPGTGNSPSPTQQQALQALREQLEQLGQPSASPHAGQPGSSNPTPGGIDRDGGPAPLDFSAEATTGSTDYYNQPFSAVGQATIKLGEITRKMPETAIADPDHSPTPDFTAGNNTLFGERHYRPKHLKTLEAYFNHEP